MECGSISENADAIRSILPELNFMWEMDMTAKCFTSKIIFLKERYSV